MTRIAPKPAKRGSPAHRKKISEALKASWARRKAGKAAPKKTATKKTPAQKTADHKRKIAAAMRGGAKPPKAKGATTKPPKPKKAPSIGYQQCIFDAKTGAYRGGCGRTYAGVKARAAKAGKSIPAYLKTQKGARHWKD